MVGQSVESNISKSPSRWWNSEDWLANWLGGTILILLWLLLWGANWSNENALVEGNSLALSSAVATAPSTAADSNAASQDVATAQPLKLANPFRPLLAKPQRWEINILQSFTLGPLLVTLLVCVLVFTIAVRLQGWSGSHFIVGFLAVVSLAAVSLALSQQVGIKYWGLEYALWAILIGLAISNTIGTPQWMRPALRTELYVKTGLVLLGAKILFGVLMKLGLPGLAVAWVVTPVVLVSTFWFGQRILKIPSKSLNMVISADMSVCGVSSAIATAAACRAKKEELSLAIGISISFTVIMMVLLPQAIKFMGINETVGGAWIGGTIDSTAAVGAAGKMIGERAEEAAMTIKMIQNVLVGVVAFCVALYWVRWVDRDASRPGVDAWEIWHRFPKFVFGFLAASISFSLIHSFLPNGAVWVDEVVKNGSEILRDWFFALAFVSIGLESNFRDLSKYLRDGKPLLLYLCGQTLNLLLTLAMATLMFG